MRGAILFCGAAVLALSSAHTARAQEGADAPDIVEADDDAIIVTAQRRAQSLQDVPVTVTVFGAEEIQQARIQQVSDVVARTPGLSFDRSEAHTSELQSLMRIT